MKSLRKKVLAMASVVAVSGLMMASVAGAADKLIVNDATGTNTVFKVDDAGVVSASRIGIGTTAPEASFHNLETSGTNTQRGGIFTQVNDGNQAAQILFQKSFGTSSVKAFPSTTTYPNPYIGIFTAQYFNGQQYDRSAQFGFKSDAPATQPIGSPVTTPGALPTAIMFFTGSRTVPTSDLTERMRISSLGNVVLGNNGGTATTDMATTVTNGFLYIPNVAGALTTCGTVTQHAGHVPVWFDTTNSKICTCQGTTLKCTAALN